MGEIVSENMHPGEYFGRRNFSEANVHSYMYPFAEFVQKTQVQNTPGIVFAIHYLEEITDNL